MGEEVILYVEGSHERAAVAYNRMVPETRDRVIWAQTPSEAIEVLANYKERLRFVFLSNDLAPHIRGDIRREDSGCEIVRWLEKQDPERYKDCRFVIQDHDKKVGRKLTGRLETAGYRAVHRPFGA